MLAAIYGPIFLVMGIYLVCTVTAGVARWILRRLS